MPVPWTERAPTRPGRHRMVVAKSLAESACPGFLSDDPHPQSHSPKGAGHKHSPRKQCMEVRLRQRMTIEIEPLQEMPMPCQIWASGQSSRHSEIRCLVVSRHTFASAAEPGSEDKLRSDKFALHVILVPPGSLPLDAGHGGTGGTGVPAATVMRCFEAEKMAKQGPTGRFLGVSVSSQPRVRVDRSSAAGIQKPRAFQNLPKFFLGAREATWMRGRWGGCSPETPRTPASHQKPRA